MCGGSICENLVGKFVSNVRFVNMLKIAHKHSLGLLEPLPIAERRFGSWSMDFITGLPLCANGCNSIFTCVRSFGKVHCFDCIYFKGGGVEC